MTARGLLAAAGIPASRVLAALPDLQLDGVSVRQAPGWLERLWPADVSAMALPRVVYVRRRVLGADPADLGGMLVHELVHIWQWSNLGVARFLWRYLSDYLGGRLRGLSHAPAYRAISLETEARRISRSINAL